ncbi:hypothetical protein SAMN02910358_00452 [Lachnospiraceae bacterium XBB1006]|nr:hypothetical protein SAMN02910358_00452 [Lachnospiraceae bacterium XBB1006]
MKVSVIKSIMKKYLFVGICSLTLAAGAVITLQTMMPVAIETAQEPEITPDSDVAVPNPGGGQYVGIV